MKISLKYCLYSASTLQLSHSSFYVYNSTYLQVVTVFNDFQKNWAAICKHRSRRLNHKQGKHTLNIGMKRSDFHLCGNQLLVGSLGLASQIFYLKTRCLHNSGRFQIFLLFSGDKNLFCAIFVYWKLHNFNLGKLVSFLASVH